MLFYWLSNGGQETDRRSQVAICCFTGLVMEDKKQTDIVREQYAVLLV